MTTNKLENLLTPCKDGDLGNIVKRAREMGELTHAVSKALPEADRSAIVAVNLREDGELVVICSSSAWASKLRYQADLLLAAAGEVGVRATACRVRVSQG